MTNSSGTNSSGTNSSGTISSRSILMSRILANRFHKGSPEALFQFLSEEEGEQLRKVQVDSPDTSALFASADEQINRIHYTWFIPIIQKVPSRAQSSLIGAFPQHHAKHLSNHLKVSPLQHSLPAVAQSYLAKLLLKHVPGLSETLPLSLLPTTPLSALSQWSKTDLVELISFLGVHDLAQELRRIVDTRRIKNIYPCLRPTEQQYLKYCMGLKEKFIAPTLGLDKWGGDCEKLKATLQARGLIRLGGALSGEHPDLIWHLAHLLDTGRGQALSKYYSKQAVPNITPSLVQQVLYLMGILKKKSHQ